MRHGSVLFTGFLVAAMVLVPGQLLGQEAMALSEPVKQHAFLERMVGTWEARTSFWMEPGKPPIESTGVSTNEMILGGRFLQSRFVGEMFGPFEGIGIDGFDRVKQKYVKLWMDNKGTMMLMFEGEVRGNARTLMAEMVGPDGELSRMKWVTTLVSDDQYRAEGYEGQADGGFRKTMEIVYTRRQ